MAGTLIMANYYGIFNQGSVLLERWEGVITLAEMLEHETLQRNDPLVGDFSLAVVDCRKATFDLSPKQLAQYSEFILSRGTYSGKKVALIINSGTWDMANTYNDHFWSAENETMSFHSIDAASAWLELDSKNVQNRLTKLKESCLNQATV